MNNTWRYVKLLKNETRNENNPQLHSCRLLHNDVTAIIGCKFHYSCRLKCLAYSTNQSLRFTRPGNMTKLSRDDKISIKTLREQGFSASRIKAAYPEKGWSLRTVKRVCQHVDKTGVVADRKPGSGRPRTARSTDNIVAVSELICSQEGQPGTSKSTRVAASALNISHMSVWRIAHNDLNMKAFKRIPVQVLNESTRAKRLTRCKQLLRRLTIAKLKRTVFSDEKVFYLDPRINTDFVWASGKKGDIATERLLTTRAKFSQRLMVSASVCYNGKGRLHFVPQKTKVNADYYQQQLLPELLHDSHNLLQEDFIFQQDGAPSHTAASVQQFLQQHCPDFITKSQWPPNSPDINPLDFYVWGAMLHRYQQLQPKPQNTEQLKVALQSIWDDLPLSEIQPAILSVRRRLRACIKVDGGHFEHLLP